MSTGRILVVDDEADIRELVQEILTEEGYAVDVAANATEARAACKRQPLGIVRLLSFACCVVAVKTRQTKVTWATRQTLSHHRCPKVSADRRDRECHAGMK